MNRTLDSALYVVTTPIGNLGDISKRAQETIAAADVIACEDTRVTSKLLSLLGIKPAKLIACHDHNEEASSKGIIPMIKKEGKSVVLVSDAGTPIVSDPGYKLVQEALANDVKIEAIPGVCSPINALVLSGLASDSFYFGGFLPTKKQAKENKILEIKNLSATVIFFESAKRLPATIEAMAVLLGDRKAAVMREMTKKFEQTVRGRLSELNEYYKENGAPKGEIVIAVAAPDKEMVTREGSYGEFSDDDIDKMLEEALKTMTVRLASDYVRDKITNEAPHLGKISRRKIYNRALELNKNKVTE
ncbi:MAG: 16S rRNA (cytidine(1402)-2'-O)-methyltransferase [Alphaproteobacteria bacterium]|nr:16S rRNA (cytidine(1402)-2'-O)-methyltransferase [Alphaproteobacteria bacterium]